MADANRVAGARLIGVLLVIATRMADIVDESAAAGCPMQAGTREEVTAAVEAWVTALTPEQKLQRLAVKTRCWIAVEKAMMELYPDGPRAFVDDLYAIAEHFGIQIDEEESQDGTSH